MKEKDFLKMTEEEQQNIICGIEVEHIKNNFDSEFMEFVNDCDNEEVDCCIYGFIKLYLSESYNITDEQIEDNFFISSLISEQSELLALEVINEEDDEEEYKEYNGY